MNVEKHSQVHKWLAEHFGPNGIPEYEICERTIDVLHTIMQRNRECDEDCQMLITDATTKCIQYETEARRKEDILKEVSMTPSSLPLNVSGKLNALVEIAQHVEVDKVEPCSLSVGMLELLKISAGKKMELKRAEFEVEKLEKRVSFSSKISEQLQKSLTHARNEVKVENEKASKYEEIVNQSKKNMQEYEEKNTYYETVLSKSGFSTSITHEELQRINMQHMALVEECKELEAKLDSFHDLPTDLNLVAEKVSKAKAKLDDLEEALNTHYQSMQ